MKEITRERKAINHARKTEHKGQKERSRDRQKQRNKTRQRQRVRRNDGRK